MKSRFNKAKFAGGILLGVAALPLLLDPGVTSPQQENKASSPLEWTMFDQGLARAKAGRKKVIVDVYTDWCTWCKKMDSDTYADKSVRTALTANFVGVKLNAES